MDWSIVWLSLFGLLIFGLIAWLIKMKIDINRYDPPPEKPKYSFAKPRTDQDEPDHATNAAIGVTGFAGLFFWPAWIITAGLIARKRK